MYLQIICSENCTPWRLEIWCAPVFQAVSAEEMGNRIDGALNWFYCNFIARSGAKWIDNGHQMGAQINEHHNQRSTCRPGYDTVVEEKSTIEIEPEQCFERGIEPKKTRF